MADISFDVIARDRASSAFNNIGKSAGHSETALSKFASVAKKAFVAGALYEGTKKLATGLAGLAKSAAEDQTSMALLAKQFRSSAHATQEQINSTEDWITAQGRAKGVADDELRPALGSLVTATHSVEKAQRLTSLAMDIAAAKGKPLSAVALALTKAYNGNVGGLGRLGIKTKDAAGKTLSFAEAQKELVKQFGGAATTKAATFTGVMDRFHVAVQEGGEAIGYKMLPYLTKVVPKITDFIIGIQDGTGAGGKFAQKVKDNVLPVLSNLTEEVKLVGGALKPILDLLSKLPPQVVAFGGASAILGSKLGSLRAPLEEGAKSTEKFGRGLASLVGGAGLIGLADSASQSNQALGGLEGAVSGAAVGLAIGGPLAAGVGFVGGGLLGIFSSGKKAASGIDAAGAASRQNLASIDAFASSVDSVTGAFNRLTKTEAAKELQDAGAFKNAEKLGVNLNDVTKATLGNAAAQGRISSAVGKAQQKYLAYYGTLLDANGILRSDITPTQAKQLQQYADLRDAGNKLSDTIGQLGDNAKKGSRKTLELTLAQGGLKKALRGIPPKTVLDISDAGTVAGAKKKILDLAATGKTLSKDQIKLLLKVANVPATLNDIQRIKTAADNAARGTRIINYKFKYVGPAGGVGPSGPAPGSPNGRMSGRAAGNAYVDAFVATVTKGAPKVKVAISRATNLLDQLKNKLSSLQDIKSGFLSTFQADNIFGTDLSEGGGFGAVLASAQKQNQIAAQMAQDLQTVGSLGLNATVLKQLQSQGASGADVLHALATGNAGQIAQFNALAVSTAGLNNSTGLALGNGLRVDRYGNPTNINAEIAAATQAQKTEEAIIRALGKMKLTTHISGRDLIVVLRAEAKSSGVSTANMLAR